jgi:hypothetical protein
MRDRLRQFEEGGGSERGDGSTTFAGGGDRLVDDRDAVRAFEEAWALEMLNAAHELVHADLAARGKLDEYDVFRRHVIDGVEYAVISADLGLTRQQCANMVRRVSERVRDCVSLFHRIASRHAVFVTVRIGHALDIANDLDDIYRHLTNTARAAETDGFDEERFVKMLEDLPSFVPGASTGTVRHIKEQVHLITRDLFRAFENEYTVFAPMPQCFELYGLDFLVDDEFRVSLLEANPGPDFKQTGTRLRRVIVELWEQTCSIVLDGPHPRCPDFTTVYDCEWSSSRIQGGMRFS